MSEIERSINDNKERIVKTEHKIYDFYEISTKHSKDIQQFTKKKKKKKL